jgi:Zn-dependent protease
MAMNWWVHSYWQAGLYAWLVSHIFWVIFSITMHELAHGWAAVWQGDDTPRRQGRLTLNPLVHMGPWSLVMFALIGIAWGVMPVEPSRFRWRRRGRIVVSGAGPAMNIALALVSLTALALWGRIAEPGSEFHRNISTFLFAGGELNLLLALFNMLPIPPLDGASVLSGLSFRAYQLYQNPQVQNIGMFILIAIFLSGMGGLIWSSAAIAAVAYVRFVSGLLGGSPPDLDLLASAGWPGPAAAPAPG